MTRRAAIRLLSGAVARQIHADETSATNRSVDFDGVRIHYETYGTGTDALVFIHGWTCDLASWRGQAPVYTKHRSILIDLPGHGQSGNPRRAYPMEFFAKSVDAAMSDAGIERATLVGHSLGGPIIYAFLRLFPEKARAMVLVDVDVRRGSAGPIDKEEQRTRMGRIASNMQGHAGDLAFARTVESCFTAKTPEGVKAQVRHTMLGTPKYVRIAAVTSPSSLPRPGEKETFGLPAIAVQASSPVTDDRFRQMKTLFPSLQLEKWEGSGHFLMMEEPERFNQTVESFLTTLP